MCMIQYRLWIGALPNETTPKLLRKIETRTNQSPVLVRGPETRTHVTPPISNEERRVWRFQGREIMRTWLFDSAICICGESSDRGAPARHGSSEGRGVVGRRRAGPRACAGAWPGIYPGPQNRHWYIPVYPGIILYRGIPKHYTWQP